MNNEWCLYIYLYIVLKIMINYYIVIMIVKLLVIFRDFYNLFLLFKYFENLMDLNKELRYIIKEFLNNWKRRFIKLKKNLMDLN